MKEKNKIILIFLPNYQSNHESYYNVLINKVFKNKRLIILAYTFSPNLLDSNKVKYYYPKEGESLNTFALKNIRLFKKADLIVFEELYKVSYIPSIILVLYGYKTLLSIHNVNKWLNRETDKPKKNFIVEIIIKTIIKRIKGLIVISLSLKDFILKNKLFKRDIYYVPFTDLDFKIQNTSIIQKDEITFTIPGTVNTERRNYKSFLEAVLMLLKANSKKEIKLVLLGRMVKIRKEELLLINKINGIKKGTVRFWDNFIEDKTFEEELLNSDYLIGNINVNYNENLIKEIYGQSKETGVLFLMLKYHIMTLFPTEYLSNKIYKDLIINYENSTDKIYDLMESLINNEYKTIGVNNSKSEHEKIIKKEILAINK